MARLTELKIGIGAGLALALVLLLAGPGCGGAEDPGDVRARSLLTGEIKTFPSADEVPQDWVVCESADCPIPPSVPCQQLSDQVCTLNPTCRLKELWCQGGGVVQPDGESTDPASANAQSNDPPVEQCEYQCIPKLPLLCEELGDEQQCTGRPDCEWAQGPCPMMACVEGEPCPGCPYSCRTKAPPICQSLSTAKQCAARADCEWQEAVCPAICQPDGNGGCLPCPSAGTCQPKTPVPPPCPPIAPPPPGYCSSGKLVFDTDANGCTVGYHCETPKTCWDLNAAYINAVKQAKACNPYTAAAMNQCSKQVENALFCPVCPTFINPANTAAVTQLTTIKQKWLAAGCDQMELPCPAVMCDAPQSATCMPTGVGGTGGGCVDDLSTP